MKVLSLQKGEQNRNQRNQSIIDRMRRGEDLKCFDSMSSWFPPRPVIAKDPKEISRLYGNVLLDKKEDKSSPTIVVATDPHPAQSNKKNDQGDSAP